PYADFIRWLGRQDFARAEEYWRRTLAGFSKPTPLGANPVWDWSGDSVYAELTRDLSPALGDQLRALARDRQLTLNTTIQGAWAILIGAASNSGDVVFGITVSGRPPELPGVEVMVGVFINTLPVRVRIKPEAKLDAWLKALQSDQAEAKEFEYSPQVQEWSEVPLAVPLFDSLVVFENYPVNRPQAAAPRQLNIRELNSPVRTKYALTMVIVPGERIRLSLSYDPRRFASTTITEIMNDFEGLLARIASRPEDNVEAAIAMVARRVSLATSAGNAAAAQAGRTPVEQMVAAIWFEVTGSNASGTRSLFEMGGHSLIATRLATRLRSTFSIALPLRHVFEAPTVRGLARRIEAELAAKRQVTAIPIQPAGRDRDLPLSYEQLPIWRVHQSLPRGVFFNFFAVLRMEGTLDVEALRASFAEIVRRHEALRTGFAEVDGRSLQQVHNAPLRMPLIDLSELPEDSRLDRAASFISRESDTPFNLAGDPLLRVTCLRVRPQEHLLCLSMHHIATDGWSSGVLAGELALLYEAYSSGRQSPLPPLPVQYPDFVVWQQELVASGAYDEPLREYVERIAANPSTLELPTDAPRPAPSFLVARGDWMIDADLLRRLRALSGRERGSLFMTLLAAFEMVLAKHSGQSEFWIGTLAANRTRPEVENMIGLFVNTLLLRCSVPPGIEFSEMLRRTREVVLDAFERQDLPFELGVQKLEREFGIEQGRLCPVLFIMQNPSLGPVSLPGLRLTPIETKTDGGRPEIYPTSFELIVNVAEEEERLVVSITYKSDLFTRERIKGMARDWADVLEAMG
ncbi:MAG TPA: condensation domain-containing protein, partial [Bryobacteraceae bacterium]